MGNWKSWDPPQRELSEIQINRERAALNELRSQLNQTMVAYNEIELSKVSLPFGKRLFSSERVEELQKKMAVHLTSEEVSTRQAGGRQEVVYIETYKALEKAQEVSYYIFDFSFLPLTISVFIYENRCSGLISVWKLRANLVFYFKPMEELS